MIDLRTDSKRTTWSVLRGGKVWREFEFALAGEYNVWNATAAAAMAAGYGISADKIATALATFKSVKRRLEVKAEINGITIIDDFAHHPTAIAGTLKALRARYPNARLWAILEPRSNTLRRNVFQHDLAQSLAIADEIVMADVFKSDAIPEAERLDLGMVVEELKKQGRRARIVPEVDAIVHLVAPGWAPAMSSQFFPMVALKGFMRSCRRSSRCSPTKRPSVLPRRPLAPRPKRESIHSARGHHRVGCSMWLSSRQAGNVG